MSSFVHKPLMLILILEVVIFPLNSQCRPEEADDDNLSKLAKANNFLGTNLHQRLAKHTSENIFFSPISLSMAFGMLYYGTRGITSQELRKVLGYQTANLDESQVHPAFDKLLTNLLKPPQDAYRLDIANSMLVDREYDLIPEYKSGVEKLYRAVVRPVDFRRNTRGIVDDVNAWVREKTSGKIDGLIEDLDPSSIMLLLNAVYFKAVWKTQFDTSKTVTRVFYNEGVESGARQVPTMHVTARFPYASLSDCDALALPYKSKAISLLVLLPNQRDGLRALEDSLTSERLEAILSGLSASKVIVSLPRFKIQYSRDMTEDFQSLGARSMLQRSADFSGMTTKTGVFVNLVLHKAVVEVNEEGSEAAAVTGIGQTRSSDNTPVFNADHPFVFYIVLRKSGMILFQGRLNSL